MNILSLLIWLPIMGAVAIALFQSRYAKWVALITTLVTLVPLVALMDMFDPSKSNMQLVEHLPWIPAFGISYILGIDGLSYPMVLLTGLLSVICIIASWNIDKQPKGYFSLFLILQACMTGVFLALDLFLFYMFWEIMLLPMYFLIGIWGSKSRVDPDGQTRGGPYAAMKFFIYTLVGSLLMLVGIIWLWNYRGNFDMRWIAAHSHLLSLQTQMILWSLFFIAFAIKIPMFPFHTWLPDAHVEAPTAVSVILAGVLLKMGTYGILRINYSLFPAATYHLAVIVAGFGVINIIYGAMCAMAQTDLKRLVAYSSISHMGYVMLGMSAFYMSDAPGRMVTEGIQGGVLQMWNHGTITAMLFLLVGVIYERAHHRDINRLGGLATTMPVYTGFVFFAFFASLGLPGLSGFIGEAFVLFGSWKAGGIYRVFVFISAIGIVITAAYHLWMIQRAFLGEEKEEYKGYSDLSIREMVTLVPLTLIIIWVGVYPAPMLGTMKATLEKIINEVLRGAL
ncbi:MAG: NADH-quinone oxidoreductase subunit M [Candidatus Lindowbacteria bacterium]|nr:NADH-quinone oxidoreductase subunit M [Candidatus Lindowbacteria bacterium]